MKPKKKIFQHLVKDFFVLYYHEDIWCWFFSSYIGHVDFSENVGIFVSTSSPESLPDTTPSSSSQDQEERLQPATTTTTTTTTTDVPLQSEGGMSYY